MKKGLSIPDSCCAVLSSPQRTDMLALMELAELVYQGWLRMKAWEQSREAGETCDGATSTFCFN